MSVFGLRLFLTSDLFPVATYTPHDASLYVSRAYHLLEGTSFGPFDERLFIKLPGFSYLLAFMGGLSIRYDLWTLSLLGVAVLYFCRGLLEFQVSKIATFILGVLIYFHPISFDLGFEVMREKVSLALYLLIGGASARILSRFQHVRGTEFEAASMSPWIVLSATVALSRLFREEDRVMGLVVIGGLGALLYIRGAIENGRLRKVFSRPQWALIALPFIATVCMDGLARGFAELKYGKGVLHDFSEGEYPKLVAAIRSLDGSTQNRHVMWPEENLQVLSNHIPEFKPVYDLMPKPSLDSYSCKRFQVCSEWTNGWIVFWLKDSAFYAGKTPNLLMSQGYFRFLREKIEALCIDGVLNCREQGSGLIRPPSLRWMRPLFVEWLGTWEMTLWPNAVLPSHFKDVTTDATTVRQFRRVVSSEKSFLELISPSLQSTLHPLLTSLRGWIHQSLTRLTSWILVLCLMSLVLVLIFPSRFDSRHLKLFAVFWFGFYFARNWALAHVSVTMGALDHRLYFGPHLLLIAALWGLSWNLWRDRFVEWKQYWRGAK
ncbi:MAG TPA: hypothetical protein PLZ57_16205 [Pseudobdellovibrionaceae bacterium]|nr:hypothetical protein [Pseudobdellovibrionaceae bacterium]